MSNIALIVVGQPRTFEFCFPSHKKHLLDVYHPDVFICTDGKGERLTELYKPFFINVLTQDEIFDEALKARMGIPSVMPMNDLSVAWKLKVAMWGKTRHELSINKKYEIVIITRFDVKLKCVPEIKAQPNTFHAPLVGGYWDTPPDKPGIHWGGLSAHLCWMDSKTADGIANIYFDQKDYLTLATNAKEQFGWSPEHVLKHYLDVNNVNIVFEDIEMMLIRGTSNTPLSYHNHPIAEYPDYAN